MFSNISKYEYEEVLMNQLENNNVSTNNIIRLDQNENYLVSIDDIKRLSHEVSNEYDLRRYSITETKTLYESMENTLNVSSNSIVLGNGGDELIDMVIRLFTKNGNILTFSPTYSIYRWSSDRSKTKIKEVSLNPDFNFNLDKFLDNITNDVKLIILCSPNNPTGTQLQKNDILSICDQYDGPVLIDEVYSNFGDYSLVNEITSYDNMILLHSLSKLGLAGIRIGYMLTNPKLANLLKGFVRPYNMNIHSLGIATKIMNEYDIINDGIQKAKKERKWVKTELDNISNFKAFESKANFHLIKLTNDVKTFYNQLLKQGIIIRDVSNLNLLENCIRVAVGNRKMNERFLDVSRDILID